MRGDTTCLEEAYVQLSRSEGLLGHETVQVLVRALLLGEREELPGHHAQQVELLHVGLEVDADALPGESRNR